MKTKTYLREYREMAHLTLKQAAEKMGIVAQTIHKWEHQQNWPAIPDLIRLAEVYGIHPSAFFMAPHRPKINPDFDAIRVVAAVAGISPTALTWIGGDLSLVDEAEEFTRAVKVFERLPPKLRQHWLQNGETYPV